MHLYNTQEGFVAAILTGTLVGFTTSFFVLYGLWHLRAKINGAPFRKGDVVQILVGQYRGQVACIYEEWRDRKQVRVDLGEQAGKDVEDVFSYIEVCRQSRAAASSNSNPSEDQ
jgi:hypothetical protein